MRPITIAVLALGLLAVRTAGAAAETGDWMPLLAGDSLKQWQAGGGESAFRFDKGLLTVDGPGQIVFMGDGKAPDLKNLELQAEVLTQPGGRAGLAFHVPPVDPRTSGGLEVRLDNSYSRSGPGKSLVKTGSLVWLRPVIRSVVPNDRWFRVRVQVLGRRVKVWVDDELLVDYLEGDAPTVKPRLGHGTFAVRGHDGSGAVQVRNLKYRPLPEPPAEPPARLDETDLRLARLREQGFPLVDYHTHLKGGLTVDEVLAHTQKTGIGHGVAFNGGVGFPIADDKTAEQALQSLRGRPVYVGLQAEGREWTSLISPLTAAKFDYVFTDAMTIVDHRGKRARLWIKDEVDIPDPEAFMDLLVKTIVDILDHEPIDVYVNPTYLPEVIAKDYDRLWTPKRVRQVIEAAARNGVAVEISNSLRLPTAAFIKQAKREGVKFTFGTNNADKKLSRLDYGAQMIDECGLTSDDLWAPKPDGKKAAQVKKR